MDAHTHTKCEFCEYEAIVRVKYGEEGEKLSDVKEFKTSDVCDFHRKELAAKKRPIKFVCMLEPETMR